MTSTEKRVNVPNAETDGRGWRRFLDDPGLLADARIQEIFTLSPYQWNEIQLSGVKKRFASLRTKVKALDTLATKTGVGQINTIGDAVPVLFPHTFYKSYPLVALETGRFDLLNAWLSSFTSVDLTIVKAGTSKCVEDWIDLIDEQTSIKCFTTSGTSGKMSFGPRCDTEWRKAARSYFYQSFQGFSGERNQELTLADVAKMPLIQMTFRYGKHNQMRLVDYAVEEIFGGDENMILPVSRHRMDVDVLSLAGRLIAAQKSGRKLTVPKELLEKQRAFTTNQKNMKDSYRDYFIDINSKHKAQRVIIFSAWTSLYDAAIATRDLGFNAMFHPDSLICTGGGMKGRELPPDWYDVVQEFVGVHPMLDGYGCSEQCLRAIQCCHNHYHFIPAIVPYVLDPDSGEMLPRAGTNTGRFAFVDLIAETYWGGFITGDEVTMTWDSPCACGRAGPYIHAGIQRYSEKRGGDDKITCAGAPDAHSKALEHIGSLWGT